jgi:hypothetical protein
MAFCEVVVCEVVCSFGAALVRPSHHQAVPRATSPIPTFSASFSLNALQKYRCFERAVVADWRSEL